MTFSFPAARKVVCTALITGGLAFGAGPTVAPLNTASVRSVSMLTQGQDALAHGDYKKAAIFYEQAVKLQRDNSSAYDGLARSYERLAESAALPGRLASKARKNYQMALNLNPHNVEALEGLIQLHTVPVGVCYGNLDETAMLVEHLNQIDPALGEVNRTRLQDAIRESRSPEIAIRCGYQAVTKRAAAAVGAVKSLGTVR